MANLKKIAKKTSPAKRKPNNKMNGVDLNAGSEIMTAPSKEKRVEEQLKDLNFKIPASFHKLFKGKALELDMSMKELLENAFDFYAAKH